MKNQFPEYYRPTTGETSQKFKECIFVFDTNVLLNLYRYTKESRDNLINVLKAIKERVWLPHQVGLEYQRGRVEELLSQLGLSAKLEGMITKTIDDVEKLNRSNFFSVNALIEPVKNDLNAIKLKLHEKKEQKPDLMTGDPVFDALSEIFDGKVGVPYKQEEYLDIFKRGKDRYDAKIPPGFMDKSPDPNNTNQYGDLLVWLQLIEYAKSIEKPIILVTDDAKEDWWREVRQEKLGPRLELIREFLAEAGSDKWFYMYSTEQFLKHSIEYLDMEVTPEAIEEAVGIEKEDAEQEKLRMSVVGFQEAKLYNNALDDSVNTIDRFNRDDEERRLEAFELFKKERDETLDWLDIGIDVHGNPFKRYKRDSDVSSSALKRFIKDTDISSSDLKRFKRDSDVSSSALKRFIKDTDISSSDYERFRRDSDVSSSALKRFIKDTDISSSDYERFRRDCDVSSSALKRFIKDADISSSDYERFKRDSEIATSDIEQLKKILRRFADAEVSPEEKDKLSTTSPQNVIIEGID